MVQGWIEVLVPDKGRFATRQQRANTKKPTIKKMQVMPENIRHCRKLATEMLRKMDLGNPPNITGKIKDSHHRRLVGLVLSGIEVGTGATPS